MTEDKRSLKSEVLKQALALYNGLKAKDLRIKNCEAYDGEEFEAQLLEKVVKRLDPID